MPNMHLLEIFRAVAFTGSVSRGAEKLMISQPAVSKQLRRFERELGVSLFDRHPRGVELTAAGRELLQYADRIFGLATEADRAIADLRTLRSGSVAIGAGPTVGVYLLQRVMVDFRRKYADVRLHLETESAEVLRQRLLDGRIEIAICETALEGDGMDCRAIMNDTLVPVAVRGHRLARQKSIRLCDFAREPLIARQVESGRSLAERALLEHGVDVTPFLTVGSTEAMKQAVIAGLGVALISRLAIRTEMAAKQLVVLPVRGLAINYAIYRVRIASRTASVSMNAFMQMVVDVAGTMMQRL